MGLLCFLLVFLVFWTTTEANQFAKLEAELEAVLLCVEDAANRGDVEEYVSYHTADCVLNFQDTKPVPCNKGISLKTDGISSLVFEGIDFIRILSDNRVYSPVSVTSVDRTGKTLIRFRIVILWLKEDGEWLIDRKFVNYKEIPPQDPILADIIAQMAIFHDGFSRKDEDAILQVYTDDVRGLFHGYENITGKTAVRGVLQQTLPFVSTLVLDKITFFELFEDGVAYTTSDLNRINENGRVFGQFRDDFLWRNVDGKWLIQIHAVNEVPLNCEYV